MLIDTVTDVLQRDRRLGGQKIINHPVAGLFDVPYDDFARPGNPHISIANYTADHGTSRADTLTLLATWIDTQSTPYAPDTASSPAGAA